jgi:hypothetical protein
MFGDGQREVGGGWLMEQLSTHSVIARKRAHSSLKFC